MTQQIMLNRHSQKASQDRTSVGIEVKTPLPSKLPEMSVIDLMGLSWIFMTEEEECHTTC